MANNPDYPVFPVRMPIDLYNTIKRDAANNERSATAQVRFILEQYYRDKIKEVGE
ncbi:hypothetical protein Nos7524_3187 [Nostoc sp. PCC 7524]|uniref:hypothetical protein n=1 Tax=Nostoc sp. (strain ATCC 29411 / PCC 7524) TaxID=28072 RepID=UPI00029F206F|nr:hypothetical protein [Nostoc sp. PCC 7524]AFY48987.1 hypothetical protein Nos7524_3187 [Nostoc sp. PCC 7524]